MQTYDQHTILSSRERALEAGPDMIDGRSEADWLCFLTSFSSLINFYDHNNKLNGNWTPFLLKDPVFLLAVISKTPFAKFQYGYINTSSRVKEQIENESESIGKAYNFYFDSLNSIFRCIRNWTYYMQLSDIQYPLKNYVLEQVQTVFSSIFWALMSLRQNLFLSKTIRDISPADNDGLNMYEPYVESIWKQNKSESPFWEVLAISLPFQLCADDDKAARHEKLENIFQGLSKKADSLLGFFNTVITHAAPAFENMKKQKSKYPDTVLLRAFIDLLKIHQQQLNGITDRHLHFYYHDILKQEKLPAVADQVFVCVEPSKKDASFELPAGTLFDAGLDLQGNPVAFTSSDKVNITPASIATACTLTVTTENGKKNRLSLRYISDPGIVKKDEKGNILSWATFGSENISSETQVKQAIAFASPLLYLKEGKRSINIEMDFTTAIDIMLFRNAAFFLSTQDDWLPVIPEKPFPENADSFQKQVVINFTIDAKAPAIERLKKQPDGMVSDWPMLKIEFEAVLNFKIPPVLAALNISVAVTNVKTFRYYNDFGLLPPKGPYTLFGPTPLSQSNFFIGNDEIFSKPIQTISFEMDWDKLPEFFEYYSQYSDYIQYQQKLREKITAAQAPLLNRIKNFLLKPFKLIGNWLIKIFRKRSAPVTFKNQYNNTCFTLDFEILKEQLWTDFNVLKKMPFIFSETMNVVKSYPYEIGNDCPGDKEKTYNLLFSTDLNNCTIEAASFFAYEKTKGENIFAGEPSLQLSPLVLTDTSKAGFMKMTLSGNEFGFGSGVFANVVSYIALHNAKELTMMANDDDYKPKFMEPANLPFVPKLTDFTAHYTTEQHYDFIKKDESYPLQCFHITPFSNYLIYDNLATSVNDSLPVAAPLSSPLDMNTGILLYQSIASNGNLFLGFDNLVASETISLYFELSRKYSGQANENKIQFSYLAANGWQELPLIADETYNLSCTGVIKLNIPGDIVTESRFMPGKKYWISICADNNQNGFAATVLLKLNGIRLLRTGKSWLYSNKTPKLGEGAIKKTILANPRIASVVQPFPSFEGKPAEDEEMMKQRVSKRIKTKDRAVSAEDYSLLVTQAFRDVYYSKAVLNEEGNQVMVYVVKAIENVFRPNAFRPLVSTCKELEIGNFLKQRASVFSNVKVSNFNLQYVQITAQILVKKDYVTEVVKNAIIDAINFFLSPWISGTGRQMPIGKAISDAEVAELIRETDGVLAVHNVYFKTSNNENNDFSITEYTTGKRMLKPFNESFLIVSGMNHFIKCAS